jgi:hypothetical protein
MSYAVVEDLAASWESYEHVAADVQRRTPQGLILYAAGRTDEGVRIIEVWESEEAWRRFATDGDRTDGLAAPRYVRDLRPTHLVLGRHTHDLKEKT